MKICHLTTAHPRFDVRIFHKICCSLALAGYHTSLVVADGMGDAHVKGVNIVDVGRPNGRLERMRGTAKRVFQKATAIDADLYHFHDPELIPVGLRLKRIGKIVVFDSHEDVPKQLLSKPYLNKPLLWMIAHVYGSYEKWACRKFDGIVAATPTIKDKFIAINKNTVDINNYPILSELTTDVTWQERRPEVCYIGGLTRVRGIREIISALPLLQSGVRLNLAGDFVEPAFEAELRASSGWAYVNELGFLGRDEVRRTLARSTAGLVTLHPIENYLDALPIKMFEYMAAGIPVIASNFPLWEKIVKEARCGICVDPLNPQEIAAAIDFMTTHPTEARRMGEQGRHAVEERFNWGIEEKKLLAFYADFTRRMPTTAQ